MLPFATAYQQAAQEVEAAVSAPQDATVRERAESALEGLRQAYKGLSVEEKEAARPMASLLASRLATLQPIGLATEAPRPTSVAAAGAMGLTDAEFTRAMLGGPEQFSVDEYADVPSRIFSGEPTPEALLAHFGYPAFREGQREAVEAALAGRDSLIIMPTGGGKSLCYQLAGMATPRLTVVVTPLVALMRDQFARLARDGHPATMLAAGLSEDHNREALREIREGTARIVFCAPERFASSSFVQALESRDVGLFVVDEAHCVSEWGHDFRPDYLRLHRAIEHLGRPTVMAATATATPVVAREIASRLGLREPLLVQGGFDRPNISFDVLRFGGTGSVEQKMQALYGGLSDEALRPAIVYCGTRKDVETVAERLQGTGLKAVGYHAGMPTPQRTKAQKAFMSGESDVVVATNAFGMGVDKADVRSVWHWAIPTSVPAYYQEAGRAGRDGLPARAILLAMRADLGRLVAFNKKRSTDLPSVQRYVDGLRREAGGADSVVIDPPEDDKERLALAIAERAGALSFEPAPAGRLRVSFLGPLDRRAAAAACQTAKDRGWEAYRAVERFSSNDDSCRRLALLTHFGDEHPPHPLGRCCDVCDPEVGLPPALPLPTTHAAPKRRVTVSRAASGAAPSAGAPPLAEGDQGLFDALVAWRKEAADGRPAYQVAKNSTLEEIAAKRPSTSLELLEIKGIGPKLLSKHGPAILGLVSQHS
jgi:RecQ family ATP-dependent DNA helicase